MSMKRVIVREISGSTYELFLLRLFNLPKVSNTTDFDTCKQTELACGRSSLVYETF